MIWNGEGWNRRGVKCGGCGGDEDGEVDELSGYGGVREAVHLSQSGSFGKTLFCL